MYFFYDSYGNLTLIKYFLNDAEDPINFPVLTNSQGDVVAIYNTSGTKLISYEYDAWGNATISGSAAIGTLNPIRYRGYYYDSDLELYYLQSRYYDAEIGRFINADGTLNGNGDIIGFNMFAYCSNNPVMFSDPSGKGWVIPVLIAIACIAVCALDHYVHKKYPNGKSFTPELNTQTEGDYYTIETKTTYVEGSGVSCDEDGLTFFDMDIGLFKEDASLEDGSNFSFFRVATAKAETSASISNGISFAVGGYAALLAFEGERTFNFGLVECDVGLGMYIGSISGGAEFNLMKGSGSYTSPSVGMGYKVSWDFDLFD